MSARKHTRRAGYHSHAALIILLFCVCTVGVLAAYMLIEAGRKSITDQTTTALLQQAQARSSAVASWFGSTESPLTALSRQEALTLFAEEVNNLPAGEAARLAGAAQPHAGQEEGEDEVSRLRLQIPAMRSLLAGQISSFVSELDLLTPDKTLLVHAGERAGADARALDGIALAAMDAALRDNAAHISSVRVSPQGNAVLTLALPVRAYLNPEQNRPQGLLVATLRLSRAVALAAMPREGEEHGLATRLLSLSPRADSPDGSFSLAQLEAGAPIPLPGWNADAQGVMPFAVRSLPDGSRVFSLCVKVPDLPLAVGADILENSVLQAFQDCRDNILLWTVALTLGAGLLTGLLWWRLVGRHAEAASREMEDLHQTVTQQHEFIANITEALSDGLVVQSSLGRILYANSAFGRILGRAVPDLMNNPPETALLSAGGETFDTRWREVLRDERPVTFTRELVSAVAPGCTGRHEHRHFQITSEPFYDEEGNVTGVVALCRDITDMIHSQERQQAMIWKTVNALSTSIEVVDPYLRGQSAHTGELALHMAALLNWDDTRRNTLHIAACLFQLGMLRLPRGLIAKNDRLTPEERQLLQSHVNYAKSMLDGIDFGLPVVDVIMQMYERMDGSGYPNGLQGDAICEEARLLAVANTFCALLRPRSYRQACAADQALHILSQENAKYDQRFVETLHIFLAGEQGKNFVTKLCA